MSAKIAQALHQVMSRVGYVQRTGKNQHFGYKYAGEADLLEKLRPAMLEAGLILIPSVVAVDAIDQYGNTTVRMEYTLAHKDGEIWPHKIGAAGCGGDRNKNGVGDKGLYKAITGANKYVLFKLFQIETGDDPEDEVATQPNDESKRLFLAACHSTIAQRAPEALEEWWKSEDHRKAIRFHDLTQQEVDDLKALVVARIRPQQRSAA